MDPYTVIGAILHSWLGYKPIPCNFRIWDKHPNGGPPTLYIDSEKPQISSQTNKWILSYYYVKYTLIMVLKTYFKIDLSSSLRILLQNVAAQMKITLSLHNGLCSETYTSE